MNPKKVKAMAAALKRKGFRQDDSHHKYFILYVNGQKTSVRTRLSRGIAEYGSSLLTQVRKQLHLSRHQFDDLIECPMSAEDYVQHLLDAGFVTIDNSVARGKNS